MKRKNKWIGMLVAVLLAMALPQTVFGAWWKPTEEKKQETYDFVWKETRIQLNQDVAPALAVLGEGDVFEQDSCAYQGKDTVHRYADFEIATYPVNKKQCVSSIYLLTDQVYTEEGIKIGSSRDDMIKAYGKDYKMEYEAYRYVKGKTELTFYLKDGKVEAIEYMIAE